MSAPVKPGLDCFTSKFKEDLLPTIEVFKSARLFDPTKVNDIKPDAATVNTLHSLKFLHCDGVIQNLKSEMPAYTVCGIPLSLVIASVQLKSNNHVWHTCICHIFLSCTCSSKSGTILDIRLSIHAKTAFPVKAMTDSQSHVFCDTDVDSRGLHLTQQPIFLLFASTIYQKRSQKA